ncbi:AI-2E family transporter [Caproiciproducens sp. MSJ-32]|nr:AI-2E family transporter [Caproiciproducens sp. MSJ-32]
MKKDNIKYFIKILSIILPIIIIIYLYIKLETISSIINLILTGIVLAYALKPITFFISEKYKITHRLSAILLLTLILVTLILIICTVVPSIFEESHNVGKILDNMDDYINKLVNKIKLGNTRTFETIYEQISEKINIFIRSFSVRALDYLINFFESLVSFAIIPIVTYYFLVDGELIYNKILLILPTEKRIVAKRIISHIDKVLSRYIVSQLLLSLIIGVLTTIVLIILNVKFAIILGIFNGILNIIPYFGPIIGAIPPIFIALIESPEKALWTVIAMAVIQQVEGNILSPKITADSTNMHPLMIIILLLLGEKLGGFIGMIIIIPIGVMIKVIYEDINDYLF